MYSFTVSCDAMPQETVSISNSRGLPFGAADFERFPFPEVEKLNYWVFAASFDRICDAFQHLACWRRSVSCRCCRCFSAEKFHEPRR